MTATWLVDGSNVARSSGWRVVAAHDDERRSRLVDAVVAWAGTERVRVVLAFDGSGPFRAGVTAASTDVELVGSGDREADDLLRHRAAALRRARTPIVIVTGDHELRESVARSDRERCSVERFVAMLLERPSGRAGSPPRPGRTRGDRPVEEPPPRDTQLRDALEPDVRARLERLRRGLD